MILKKDAVRCKRRVGGELVLNMQTEERKLKAEKKREPYSYLFCSLLVGLLTDLEDIAPMQPGDLCEDILTYSVASSRE